MRGSMMAALNRKILSLYVRLGVRLGHWSSLDQKHINQEGKTTRRLYADWDITMEEWEK